MRRWITLYLPPLLGVIIILVKLPEIDSFIRNNYENAPFLIGIVLCGATILTHILTVISPFKKYERLANNKWVLVDKLTSSMLGKEIFPGYNIVANVMKPKWTFYCTLEPHSGSKLARVWRHLGVKRLVPIYLSNGHALNKEFKITVRQGVSGKAYSKGVIALADLTTGLNDLNLSEKQKKSVSGNGFVISYPIFAFDAKYQRVSNKIIGVVTLSCSTPGSHTLIANPNNREILTEKTVEFSTICSLLL